MRSPKTHLWPQFQFRLLLSFLCSALLTGCLGGSEEKVTATSSASLTSLTLKGYDTLKSSLNVKGSLRVPAGIGQAFVVFHASATCDGLPLGQGVLADFSTQGIDIKVPSTGTTKIHVTLNTNPICLFLTEYTQSHEAPPTPILSATSPASPSRATASPRLFGSATVAAVQVRFFDDASCSHEVGLGTPEDFATIGIQVALTPAANSEIYAVAREAFGNTSACTRVGSYNHDIVGPAAPAFASTAPVSPSSTTTSPLIRGTASSESTRISLFSEATCTTQVGTGTTDEFRSTGIHAEVPTNATTVVYAVAYNAAGNPSNCTYLTTYIHDNIAPIAPIFSSAAPASPTRVTTYPKIKGIATSDTSQIKLYSDLVCLNLIGTGSRLEFEGAGISASVKINDTSSVYGVATDAAGNASTCTNLTSYRHNTIPPDPPVWSETRPVSPNNSSSTPFILGTVAPTSVSVRFYFDESCTTMITSGLATDFIGNGIQVTVPANSTTQVYVTATDPEGNVSSCAALTEYAYSTNAAPAPAFSLSVPPSPTRATQTPWIVGTADAKIRTVQLFFENTCTNLVATGSRTAFTTSGMQVTVDPNARTSIYAVAFDVYGNPSACTFLTDFVHNTIPPFNPTFLATAPASPTRVSTTPLVTGSTTVDPFNILPVTRVNLYDSSLCISFLGGGTPAEFSGAGVSIAVPANAVTSIYARTADAAGNTSNCTHLTDYMHVDVRPGQPTLVAATPNGPSYTQNTYLTGTIPTNASLLPPLTAVIYSDASCSTILTSGTATAFRTTGIPVVMNRNTTTPVHAAIFDQVGNASNCTFLTNFFHNDLGPINLYTTQNIDGSVNLDWSPDSTASPTPQYVVKRALKSGGPYTILDPGVSGNSYRDLGVTNGVTYYYVIAGTNTTGTSLDSAEVVQTVAVLTPNPPISLSATSAQSLVNLNWLSDSSNMTFKVLRATQRSGPYTTIASKLTTQNYIDTNVVNSTAYYYVIVGTNPAGASAFSNEAQVVPLVPSDAPAGVSLALRNGACGGGSQPGVLITWSSTSHATSYNVYRGQSAGGGGQLISTGSNSYVDCNPYTYWNQPAVNRNYYSIRAAWGLDESASSASLGMANNNAPTMTFIAPGNGVVYLNWNTDSLASSYTLLRATQSGGPYTVLDATLTNPAYTDTAVTNDNAYFYVLQSNYSGISGWFSPEYSAIPSANPTSAPSNLTLTLSSTQMPILTWTPSTKFNRFIIYRASAVGGPYTAYASTVTTTLPKPFEFIDPAPLTGLNFYRVTAYWGSFESAATNVVSYRSGIPLGLTATATSTSVNLTWSAITGANGYKVYRGTSPGGPYTAIATPATNSYSDTSAVAATGYFYYVTSTYLDATESPKSIEVSGMRTGSMIPSGLTITSSTSNSITLGWAKVTGATTYNIYRANAVGGPYTRIGTSGQITYVAAGLTNSTHYFKVTSVAAAVESGDSSIVSGNPVGSISAPTLTAGNGSVSVFWGGVAGGNYTVERSTDGYSWSAVASGLSSTNYVDSTVSNGILYYFRIIGVASGSTLTSAASSSTPGIVPLDPTGLTVVNNLTGTSVDVSFSGVPLATSYRIFVGTASGGPYTFTSVTASQTSNINIPGLNPGTTYYMVARALIGSVLSAGSSNEVKTIPFDQVLTPAPTVAAANATSIGINWSSVSGIVTSYEVFRSSNGVDFTSLGNVGTATTYTDTTAVAGTVYSYYYQPYGPGAVPMAPSATSNAITLGIPPLTPASLWAEPSATTQVALSWISTPSVASYRIYRSGSSGGPYSLLTSLPSTATTHLDSTVSPGNSYYYVIRALNGSGVESANSNEARVSLVTSVSGVAANAAANAISVSWNALGGASGYQVRRSETSGGPYGVVASGLGVTSFTDSTVSNGTRYYYIVNAQYAGGEVSTNSSEASAIALVTMNIEVPIELTDKAISSDVAPVTFERTRTSLNTSDYDGTVSYRFEIVTINGDANPTAANLVDSSGAVVATLAIPAGTYTPQRLTTNFTPTAGASDYRVRLDATGAADDASILAARIFITQAGATRTKLYFPLLSAGFPSRDDLAASVTTLTSGSYSQLATAIPFRRSTTDYVKLADTNAWEFEALVASTGGAIGSVALNNTTRSSLVDDTESLFNSAAISTVRASFNEGVTSFGSTNEGDDFEVVLRCQSACTSGKSVSVYKAGLWLRLSSLEKLDVVYRTSQSLSAMMTYDADQSRTLIDLSKFTNPSVYFQATAFVSPGDSATVQLMSAAAADFGPSALNPISGSILTFSSMSKTQQRTGAAFTINSGERFLPEIAPVSGSINLIDSSIVIRTQR